MILIISFISSSYIPHIFFEMNKVIPSLALTAPFLLIFLSKLSIIDKVGLVANLDKTYLAKEQQGLIMLFA